ncbi:MAG: helix-hairpin-helix domain-containing protein, partial [Verrucomicrobiota bacterium]
INVTQPNPQPLSSPLFSLLVTNFGSARAMQIMGLVGPVASSPLDFFVRSKLSQDDFAKIADRLTTTNGAFVEGLIDINSASKEVLVCLPGIGLEKASSVIAYRQSNPDKLTTVAWLAEAIEPKNAVQAGPYVTVHSYQFAADIAAVGENGRGFRRVKFIFDTSDGTPKIIYRQDLTHLGWALGSQTRQQLLALQTR